MLAGARTDSVSLRLPNPRLLAVVVLMGMAVWWTRSTADRLAAVLGGGFGRAVFALSPRVEAVPKPTELDQLGSFDDPGGAAFGDLDAEDPEADGLASPSRHSRAKASSGRAAHKKHRSKARSRSTRAVYVAAKAVLRLANSGARPNALPVVAKGKRPAGLALRGVSRLGVGMRDGDVLTRVAGQPVHTVGDVVALVLVLRSKGVPRISAEFWRRGARWSLVVEQPYVVEPPPTTKRSR